MKGLIDHALATGWRYAKDRLRVDPYAEDVYRSLMRVHHRLGRSTEVEKVYQRCQTALAARLGAAPSPEIHAFLTVGRLP
jgi:DNA-binding SARP family transcriptional activator